MKKEKIILIGGGGHCRSVIDVIELQNKYEIAGIVDKKELIGQQILGYEIIGCDNDLEELFETYKYALVSIGQIKSPNLRITIFEKLKKIGYFLPIIQSPLAYISKHATLKEGTIVMHHALINSNAIVGKNCIINTKALVEHDCIVQDNCHISTSAVLNGGTRVMSGTFFGSNAVCKEGIKIAGFVKAGELKK